VTKVTVTKVTSRLWKAPDLKDDASSIISECVSVLCDHQFSASMPFRRL